MSKSAPPAQQPQTTLAGGRAAFLLLVLGMASIAGSLMQTLVIPIQGLLPELLDAAPADTSWVITATLLTGAVTMPVSGRLADLSGKKPVLVASTLFMLLGSILCATSSELWVVLLGRALQGVAMGYIPVAISLAREVMPKRLVNTATALISATLGVGGALGLPFGAWIAQSSDWHFLFWISGGMAALMTVLTLIAVPSVPPRAVGGFDWLGALGLAIGLAGVLIGVTKGNDWGWTAPPTISLIAGGAAVLLLWGVYELRCEEPLVNLRTSVRLPVLFTNLAAVMAGLGMMAKSIIIPQLLQLPSEVGHGLGQSILEVGLWMAPGGIMMLLFSPVSGRMLTRFGGRITLIVGSLVVALGYGIAMVSTGSPLKLMLVTCVTMAGVGISYAALPTIILDNVPAEEAASSVAVNGLMRSVGTTLAGAIMAIVLTSSTVVQPSTGAALPSHDAFLLGFGISAVATLLAAVFAVLIPRRTPGRRASATTVEATTERTVPAPVAPGAVQQAAATQVQ